MRPFIVVALMAVGCAAASPPKVVHPVAVVASPDVAVAAARSVIDARYGIDPSTKDRMIVGKAEWLDDAYWIAHRWERGALVVPMSSATWFQVVALIENRNPGEVYVRVVGLAATGDERFDGMEPYIQSGDPRMPAWAEQRIANLQTVINSRLRKYAVH